MNDVREPMNQEVSNLIAFLLSDGSMNLKKSKNSVNHRISLEVVSKPLCEEFQRTCKNIFGRTSKIVERHRNLEHSKSFRMDIVISQEEAKRLLSLVKTFRTRPINGVATEAQIPDEVMEGNNEIKQNFLKIFASAEGSVILAIDKQRKWWAINRWISIKCCHPMIHNQIKQLLIDLGINAKSVVNDIRIKGKENLIKFRELISFLNGCKVTKKSLAHKLTISDWTLRHESRSYETQQARKLCHALTCDKGIWSESTL
ncbi:hypothetical protein HZC32_02955 [Candidatus Woesearchaeota archaeon]|nr:hypothetical protein [Candidatus Woesearchaeota archaeon]